MADSTTRVQWIGPEPRTVPALGNRYVMAGEIVDVPSDLVDSLVCQVDNWKIPPKKKAAANTDKESD